MATPLIFVVFQVERETVNTDIANKGSKRKYVKGGSLKFLQRAILVSYEIVLCIFKYELHIQRLNVNSRVSRIEDQK